MRQSAHPDARTPPAPDARTPARAFLARVLAAEFGTPDRSPGLAAFQRAGVTAVERALDVYGGVVLADEVGLGKTHLAAAVAARRGPVTVIAPAHLREMWTQMCPQAEFLSHAALARRPPIGGCRLAIVDEAQRFTNANSARYRALAEGFEGAGLLLVTATPLGMGRHDISALVRLFLPPGALAPVLGDTLERWLDDPDADWTLLTRTVLVRRSRRVLEAAFADGIDIGDEAAPLHFPTTTRSRLTWSAQPAVLSAVLALSDHLDQGPLQLPPGLARTLLLSRLESSVAAVDGTLGRFAGFLTRRLEARRGGADLDRSSWRRFFGGLSADLDRQTVLPFVFDTPREHDAPDSAAILRCLDRVNQCRRVLNLTDDPKHSALAAALDDRKSLVFTRSSESALALFEYLRHRFPHRGLGLVRGDLARIGGAAPDARVDTAEVMDRFGPTTATASQQVTWLIATDVLSEGANLQHCARVISYDIPWNPLRLVQRHGRVDRLGPGRREVEVITLVPTGPIEEALRLVDRVSRRAAEIESALGDSGALAGVLSDALTVSAVPTEIDQYAALDLRLRTLHQRLGQPPSGAPQGLTATGREATAFVFDLGVQGAALFWCLVTREDVSTRRGSVMQLLVGLEDAVACPSAPPAHLRRAMTAAWAWRRRLREVTSRPCAHPPRSAAGRLLRLLATHPTPGRTDSGFPAWVLLHAVLRRPLSTAAAMRLAAALDAGTTCPRELACRLGRPARNATTTAPKLLAFVAWRPGLDANRPPRQAYPAAGVDA